MEIRFFLIFTSCCRSGWTTFLAPLRLAIMKTMIKNLKTCITHWEGLVTQCNRKSFPPIKNHHPGLCENHLDLSPADPRDWCLTCPKVTHGSTTHLCNPSPFEEFREARILDPLHNPVLRYDYLAKQAQRELDYLLEVLQSVESSQVRCE